MAASDPTYVQKQIQHMLAFIEQEAHEKADEIDSKAEEEFNLSKGSLVTEARQKIMDEIEKRRRQIELERKIQGSKMLNNCRLKVLREKEDRIDLLIEETRHKLSFVTARADQYREILEKLLLQGLLQLIEENVLVRCRKADVPLLEKAKITVAQQYTQLTNKKCAIDIDKNNFLSDRSGGGMELYARRNRIFIDNTLEKRLEQVSTQMMPQIRKQLFGANANRRFKD
ncbi:V-type proton ATPase subunit E [Galendromus occidentalis]|uniref:V-type proton ATPase subunit E n=1 Tax=Galendromus occidentalis TaxID=34638 RepID=A0AAJ6VWM6_9ACAR|nr:V-type proton ATPase subunit E [Galendromus occidentalis]